MPSAGLKYNAISKLIRQHMMERRRKASVTEISDISSSMDESSASNNDQTGTSFTALMDEMQTTNLF